MKVKYEGGQVLTDVMPDLKKTRFSFGAVLFFIFCATSGGAFGIESIIPASGPGMTLVLLVIIPLMWALPMGLYVSELTNLAPVDSGPYVWVKMAFGEFWGFAFGLWMAVAWYLTGASYIVLATDYIGMYINMSPMVELAVKVVIILVFQQRLPGASGGKCGQYHLYVHNPGSIPGCSHRWSRQLGE